MDANVRGAPATTGKTPLPDDDLLIGARPIATWLGLPVRQVFYMAERRQLPLFKIGSKWACRKSTIKAHFAALEVAAADAGMDRPHAA
jgi:hypothetical protein